MVRDGMGRDGMGWDGVRGGLPRLGTRWVRVHGISVRGKGC